MQAELRPGGSNASQTVAALVFQRRIAYLYGIGCPAMIGQVVAHYRILEQLGKGGMGVVFMAEDTRLGRRVAVKFSNTDGDDTQFRQRFLREARLASSLNHPNIASIYDYGETTDGFPFIVMELVKGRSLHQHLKTRDLTLHQKIKVVIDVAAALSEAHKHGIIHRDIKPSNVVINERDDVKVLDFGLARQFKQQTPGGEDSVESTLEGTITRHGVVLGTPHYMSPEQARGVPHSAEARSDLFSLGVLLYQCLADRLPFNGGTTIEVCGQVLNVDPPPPSTFNSEVTADLDCITIKALAKKPQERFQSADEMIVALREATYSSSTRLDALPTQAKAALEAQITTVTEIVQDGDAIALTPKGPGAWLQSWAGRAAIGVALAALLFAVWAMRPSGPAAAYVPSSQARRFYDEGVNALRDGAYYRASKAFARVNDIDGEYAIPHARLAEAWIELDYSDRANAELVQSSTLITSRIADVDKLYLDALGMTASYNFSGAAEKYRELITRASGETKSQVYVDLGRSYERGENTEAAKESYSQAIALDPQNASAVLRLGLLHARQQQFSLARTSFDKAESIYSTLSNNEGVAEVFFQRGTLATELGKLNEARDQLNTAGELAKRADNTHQQIRTLLALSRVAYAGGHTEEAQKLATEAIKSAEAAGIENLATKGLIDLGQAYFKQRDYEQAEQYFQKALSIARKDKGRRNEASANFSLGSLYVQMGKVDEGLPFIDSALRFYQAGGYRHDVAQCLLYQGRGRLLKGDYESALKLLDEQLAIAKQIEGPAQIARTRNEIALALGRHGLLPQALNHYAESYRINRELGNVLYQGYCLLNRADLLSRLGRYQEAHSDLGELTRIVTGLDETNKYRDLWPIWIHLIKARLALDDKNYSLAISEGKEAYRLAGDPAFQPSAAEALSVLGLAYSSSGNSRMGIRSCERACSIARQANDQQLIPGLTLALAKVQLEAGAATDSLNNASHALEGVSGKGQAELEWQAWSVAGQANSRSGNAKASIEQFARARQSLSLLRQSWGENALNTYLSRPELRKLYDAVSEVSTASPRP